MFRIPLFLSVTLLLMGLAAIAQAGPGGQNRNFRAHLSGDEEVPEADTLA